MRWTLGAACLAVGVAVIPVGITALSTGPSRAGDAATTGKAAFEKRCAACHRSNGRGSPGIYPPLRSRLARYVTVEEGRRYLVQLVSYGMFGRVEIGDRTYTGVMPAFAQWSDAKIAAVLNYVLKEFNGDNLPSDFEAFTAEEVQRLQEPRHGPGAVREKLRTRMLEALERADRAGNRPTRTAGVPQIGPAAEAFARNCQGCHRADGRGAPGSVPRLQDFVGYFTRVDGGRAYLVQVPGVAFSRLDDAMLARVLNWTLKTFGAGEVAPGFEPYTTQEVKRLRADPIDRVHAKRARMLERMREAGYIAPGEDGIPPATSQAAAESGR